MWAQVLVAREKYFQTSTLIDFSSLVPKSELYVGFNKHVYASRMCASCFFTRHRGFHAWLEASTLSDFFLQVMSVPKEVLFAK